MEDSTSHKSVNNEDSRAGNEREELIARYEALPAEERRQRLLVLPDYADRREELIQPERVVQQFQYFWDKWVPMLGPVPSMLYMKLRQFAYYNRRSGELREEITRWPKQDTLARSIGIRDKKAVMRALKTLEEFGLIRREPQYRYDKRFGKKIRTTDRYWVKILDIVTPEDQIGLLLEEIQKDAPQSVKLASNQGDRPKSQKGTLVNPDVENSGPKSQKGTYIGGPKKGLRIKEPLTSTYNVRTFEKSSRTGKDGQTPLAADPRIRALDNAERGERERMVDLVDEVLKKIEDNYSVEPHRNYGLHKRFAMLLPATRVQEALAATQDAVQRERAGDVSLRKSPAHYFAGVCRNIAAEEGIDLGINWRSERPEDAVDAQG